MKLSKLLENIEIKESSANPDAEIKEIVFDSRKAAKGTVFVALKGVGADGHDYVEKALENGAECCIVERDVAKSGCVRVENTRKAMAVMAANMYGNPQNTLKFIGVTGTNGKTTSTYLIKQVLQDLGYNVGLIGTIQNMIGDRVIDTSYTTPEPTELFKYLAEMRDSGVDYVVMEVSSQALDQERVYGIHFEIAVFTNLTQDHLDYHKTMENYLDAKIKLFKMCDMAVLNLDEDVSRQIAENCNGEIIYYSRSNSHAKVFANNIEYRRGGVDFVVFFDGKIARIKLNIPGKFTVYNALCVISVCVKMGISLPEIAASLAKVQGVKGRAEVVPTGEDFTVIIDYAHTPDALMNIISAVRTDKSARLVTIFGCGGDRDRTKRPIMGNIATGMSDFTIITSDNPRSEEPSAIIDDILGGVRVAKSKYKVIENRKDAIFYAIENAKSGDTILLAGKGHETYQILKSGKIHFDEREIVAQALEKRRNRG